MTYLILGASGTVGSTLANLLSEQGHEVRRATRTPRHPQDVQLNLLTGEGLSEAVTGVKGLFLMSPPGYTAQDQLLKPAIDAAREAKVERVVLMTAMGADADDSIPFRQAELYLEQSGLAYQIIRPNWFMQNFNSYWIHDIQEHNEIALPVGDAATSFIDARDIAAVAAELLTSDRPSGAYSLTGPEALTHGEVAERISAQAGRQITFRDISPEATREKLLAAGLPEDYAGFMLTILDALKQGYAAAVTSSVEDILGRPARTFTAYVEEHRAAFQSPVSVASR